MNLRSHAGLVAALLLLTGASAGQAQELSARVEAEGILYPASPADSRQVHHSGSIAVGPEWEWEFGDRRHLVTFEGFARIDSSDPVRTHADLRVVSWEYAANDWELRVGMRRVYWGVTESQHLVDVINQTDLIESPDGEDKLGQPMVNFALITEVGTFDAFVMPLFRERTYPGPRGRLRFQPRVETAHDGFLDGIRSDRTDIAARWSHYFGAWDFGVSHFRGTSRDPRLSLGLDADGVSPVLLPVYEVIDQTGLDVQMTTGGWLWKLESIVRSGQGDRFAALTAGFEYTFGGFLGSVSDLGVLLEYSWDERGEADLGAVPEGPLGFSLFQNDIFVGSRLALNDIGDTAILAGGLIDLDTGALLMSLEASRRIADGWTMEIEGRAFAGSSAGEPLYSLRRDDYVRVALVRFF
jgi:hypothetical protein